MLSTLIFVMIMSKFYRDQHYKGYISEQEQAILYNRADKLAKTDELTRVDNRRNFIEILRQRMARVNAGEGAFYLVIFDVDYFKQINDSCGHAFGDKVLIEVIQVVKKHIRSNDLVGRYGGDEFMLCLDFDQRVALETRLLKILLGIRALSLTCGDKPVPVSISIGAARYQSGRYPDEEKLIAAADVELFNVKKSARGKFSISD
jgi:diguanylate cyclase (GGDEF)-like protein